MRKKVEATSIYWIGIVIALISGVIKSVGQLIQKKVIVDLPEESKLMKSLVRNRIWVAALFLDMGIGTILFFVAQSFIGPVLVPGIIDIGLIVLAIGSVKIIGDTLKKEEILAIFLIIVAVFLLSFSELDIKTSEINFLDIGFLSRITIYTSILFTLSILFEGFQRKNQPYKGIILAILSGFMFAISNLWVSIFTGIISQGFSNLVHIILFLFCCLILPLTNALGIIKINQSFKEGKAHIMIPIQQIPLEITPIIIYFMVFLLTAPKSYSLPFIIIAGVLLIICSYLLGKRQIKFEAFK
ncbi:MAG: hypothetical protein ACTSRI_07810 [Promethearchaeota archaeon]